MSSSGFTREELTNEPAPGIPYFTPLQNPPAGTAVEQPDDKPIPKVFQPIKLRGLTLQNRIMLSPLCQYSAEDGHYTMWGHTHMGGIVQRGPGISCIEAAAVVPEGRITPQDVGIWKDSQIEPLRKTVEFAHSQNQKIMIQLAHAGRKASCVAPWIHMGHAADESMDGWPNNVKAPTGGLKFDEHYAVPKAMTKDDIEEFKAAFVAATKRSVAAGFDAIEIHNAHGYLLHEFLSPATNKRTDNYGGSFENRIRLTVEIVDLVRQTIPDAMPLFLRVSATDWLEETEYGADSWTLGQTIELAKILADRGVDVLDVSSGGNHPEQKIKGGPGYQAPFSLAIKEAIGDRMVVAAVGAITSGKQANVLLENGIDAVFVGRMFQKNPGLVFSWADELDVKVQMPNQIRWGFAGRGGGKIKTGNESKQKL
ncbi:NADPH dehydrogenase [Eremomyces bilateralis CBS 781.70]|uniref:NADPH dehydrogenase n=1 Tax=Eremomyces bilateralis CBS 781.70 TaxID=1392243 RepID=A0A6G1FVE8_9PEZI|nr:NADPH dehydrogenase [Eremomyces bilateralis CBS 781.70]KAF1809743.1 NADPH dehydrogenase [Eremomyces bilateralis CBS 781.70]